MFLGHKTSTKEDLLESTEEYKIPSTFHPNNRKRVLESLKKTVELLPENAVILLKSAKTKRLHDTDVEFHIKQESNFWYLFGSKCENSYGMIHVDTGKTTLFVPEVPKENKMWMVIHDKEYLLKNAPVDEVFYVDEMENVIKQLNPATIFLNYGKNRNSGRTPDIPTLPFLENYTLEKTKLYNVINQCRVIKSEEEIKLMKYIGKISSDAHKLTMKFVKPGLREYQLEAVYKFHCMNQTGSRDLAYDCIVGSGTNASILHYDKNQKLIEDGDLILCDQGFNFYGYCSDITITFPANGKFTKQQSNIYNVVLRANRAVTKAVKPGVTMYDLHKISEEKLAEGLLELGLVNNYSIEELDQKNIISFFYPHSIGHHLGLDGHDVVPAGKIVFAPGMVVTNEPGIYFIKNSEEKYRNDPELAKYINWTKYDEYKSVGGVRIEDDILVTEDGCELLMGVPRTIEEIELFMSGKN